MPDDGARPRFEPYYGVEPRARPRLCEKNTMHSSLAGIALSGEQCVCFVDYKQQPLQHCGSDRPVAHRERTLQCSQDRIEALDVLAAIADAIPAGKFSLEQNVRH